MTQPRRRSEQSEPDPEPTADPSYDEWLEQQSVEGAAPKSESESEE